MKFLLQISTSSIRENTCYIILVFMDTLDALIIRSIETIRYSKKKRPDKVKLAEIMYRLAFLIKEGRLENQHCLITITLILPMKARLKLIMLLPQLLLAHVQTI